MSEGGRRPLCTSSPPQIIIIINSSLLPGSFSLSLRSLVLNTSNMRSSTLIALLPLLAATHTAAHRSYDHHHRHGDDEASTNINHHHHYDNINKPASPPRVSRKSLGFGPVHEHARFVVPDQDSTLHEAEVGFDGKADVDVARIARDVVRSVEGLEGAIEGEDYFVREDVSFVRI
jgi:hypothetical protein